MKKPTPDQIDKAKKVLSDAGYIIQYWHFDDLHEAAGKKLSKKRCETVRQYLEDIDANIGINWESIEIALMEA